MMTNLLRQNKYRVSKDKETMLVRSTAPRKVVYSITRSAFEYYNHSSQDKIGEILCFTSEFLPVQNLRFPSKRVQAARVEKTDTYWHRSKPAQDSNRYFQVFNS